jgi:hypothetical protein
MKGAGELRCDFQDLVERGVRERIVERFVDVREGHAICKAFEDEFDRETCTPDGELAAQEFRVRHNPLVVLIRPRLPIRHRLLLV